MRSILEQRSRMSFLFFNWWLWVYHFLLTRGSITDNSILGIFRGNFADLSGVRQISLYITTHRSSTCRQDLGLSDERWLRKSSTGDFQAKAKFLCLKTCTI